ncbi:hypothetical protein I4U23_021703 [Adineta vaga]|nr:hypothetical protein I4U23_021703 [Adineta vaga]
MDNTLPLQNQENVNPATGLTKNEEQNILYIITQMQQSMNSIRNDVSELKQGLSDLTNKIKKQDNSIQKLTEELAKVKPMCRDNSSGSTSPEASTDL